mgnify:CR=1 FL=1
MDAIKKLRKYGEVKTCKLVHEDVATIVVTNGFSENAMKTLAFVNDCQQLFPDHTVLETCITELNFAMVVLKK